MRSLLIGIILLALPSELFAQTNIRPDYKSSLDSLIKNIDLLDHKTIAYSIPETKEESKIFFALDYNRSSSKNFQTLLLKIEEYALKKDTVIMMRYLYLSEFVDGYFAEDYFDSLEKIASKEKRFLCTEIRKAEKNRIKRLEEITQKYCK